MANDTVVTIIGNLTADPELRFTPSGAPVANFTVASTPRQFDRQSNAWKDGDSAFWSCSVWRESAENVAESLTKGARVIVYGRLKQRTYETKDGDKRTVTEVEVDEIGAGLRYATVKISRTGNRSGGGQGGQSGGDQGQSWGASQPAQQSGGGAAASGPADDPWGSPTGNAGQAASDPWG